MIRNLFQRIRAAGKRSDARVKETAKTSHNAPVMSEIPPKVDTLPDNIKAANEAINAAPVAPAAPAIDAAKLFAYLRSTTLRHRVPGQVEGTEAIIAAMAGKPVSWVAYALATAWHETGAKMQPNVENLNYSASGLLKTFSRTRISRADAERLGRTSGKPANQRAIGNIIYGGNWGRQNLGNTEPDDGWTYRGRGLEHVTGRRNYLRTGQALGIDLIGNPDALLNLGIAVRSLVTGMETGRYVPNHDFARHLPSKGDAMQAQFREARRIINGVDKSDLLAGYAMTFQAALRAGGWK